MKNAASAANVAEPDFDWDYFFKVTFERNPSINALSTVSGDRTAIENGDRISAVLEYLEVHSKASNSDFAELLGLRPTRTREILQDLVQEGLIEKHGEKRHTYYTSK
jgi:predicted HTH transcriptional regulator